jgi:hypothetical protein
MTPMFSAHVVVADPPPKPANVVEFRQPHPRCGRDRRGVDLAEDQRQDVTRDHGQKDRQPVDDAAEARQCRDEQHPRDEADQWALLEVRLGRGRQVEADQREDRSRHHRWQCHVDPVRADTAAVTGAIIEKLDPR